MQDLESIECTHDGTPMSGFVIQPADGEAAHAAVLMFPGATGTGPTFERRARELAGQGYLAIGASVYGTDDDISTPESAGEHFMALLQSPDTLRGRLQTWYSKVAAMENVDPGRIAAIGYCFGGKCVLELARSGADLRAAISFHGLLTTDAPARPGVVKARIVAYCAGQDPYAPIETVGQLRDELTAAGVDHQITIFSDAQHSFSDPDHDGLQPGIAYDAVADAVSWAGATALLSQALQ